MTQDKTLICISCNNEFVFSKDEQLFYQSKNLLEPKLCPICRSIKKQTLTRPEKPKN